MNDWINTDRKNSRPLFDLAAEYWGDQVLVNTYVTKINFTELIYCKLNLFRNKL